MPNRLSPLENLSEVLDPSKTLRDQLIDLFDASFVSCKSVDSQAITAITTAIAHNAELEKALNYNFFTQFHEKLKIIIQSSLADKSSIDAQLMDLFTEIGPSVLSYRSLLRKNIDRSFVVLLVDHLIMPALTPYLIDQ
ncbi:hypothetical protein [Paenibacillus sp. QZ-Y1]|uniref:hypothetical protein n=1 Tax=Paenibacillus sp. QZ-Y1 TaxID=3414511 RepID=UPI003F797388